MKLQVKQQNRSCRPPSLKATLCRTAWGLFLGACLMPAAIQAAEPGVTDQTIRIGSTFPLEGDYLYYGQSGKSGIEAAIAGQSIQKRTIQYEPFNDFYTPVKAVEGAKELIKRGLFAMLFSSGTASAEKVLPVLAENKVIAFGFYIGAAFTEPGDILNFRASYAAEVETVIEAALSGGKLKPSEVCAYVQNDGFGMSGIKGFRNSMARRAGMESVVAKLDQILAMPGEAPERNNIGPVGVHPRDTTAAREGYLSLKEWEKNNNTHCRLIVTMTFYEQAAPFISYARFKEEPWTFGVASLTTARDSLIPALQNAKVTAPIIATRIVPPLDSPLPAVADARKALGDKLNHTSLESYLVGRLFVAILKAIDGPITRENFLKAARAQPYDIGGIKVDFTTDNQGSDYVGLMLLRDGSFKEASPQEVAALFK